MTKNIAIIRGDCIGPEIMAEAIGVLDAVAKKFGHTFKYTDAPMGGGMLFHARIEVRGPADMDEAALRGELERIAGALMVDINLREPG